MIQCLLRLQRNTTPLYNNSFNISDYKTSISYKETQANNTVRSCSRNIIWFNPAYSMNIKANVAKIPYHNGQKLPKTHRLHILFNRNNVKVGYSCFPNISNIITSHNSKILYNKNEKQDPKLNCRRKETCLFNGKCLDSQLIYSCHIKTVESDEGLYYIGLTEKCIHRKMEPTSKHIQTRKQSKLHRTIKCIGELKGNGTTPIISP